MTDGKNIEMSCLRDLRKQWREHHETGFSLRLLSPTDGSVAGFIGEIRGKEGTPWEDSIIPITMENFSEFPERLPKCRLPRGFFHMQVFPSGLISLDDPLKALARCEGKDADYYMNHRSEITINCIMKAVREMLAEPDLESANQREAYTVYNEDRAEYERRVREQAARYKEGAEAAEQASEQECIVIDE
mmetsp:Transcript_1157/g.4313  ORF Transcript_1157/g.4313 Transcript_1157/m.4313 type:complete len:189 (+) Transcript_1157:205-771(+)